SKTDTFGNVVTEAMASGLAVVSFDYAAAHEHITHQHNGMLAAFDDSDAFMHCASELAERPNLLQQLRQQARQDAESIRWDSIVDDFILRLSGASSGGLPHGTEQNSVRPQR